MEAALISHAPKASLTEPYLTTEEATRSSVDRIRRLSSSRNACTSVFFGNSVGRKQEFLDIYISIDIYFKCLQIYYVFLK